MKTKRFPNNHSKEKRKRQKEEDDKNPTPQQWTVTPNSGFSTAGEES